MRAPRCSACATTALLPPVCARELCGAGIMMQSGAKHHDRMHHCAGSGSCAWAGQASSREDATNGQGPKAGPELCTLAEDARYRTSTSCIVRGSRWCTQRMQPAWAACRWRTPVKIGEDGAGRPLSRPAGAGSTQHTASPSAAHPLQPSLPPKHRQAMGGGHASALQACRSESMAAL